MARLGRQSRTTCLNAIRQQNEAEDKRSRRRGNRHSHAAIVVDPRTDEKVDHGADISADGGDKCKRSSTHRRRILLRQPQAVHGKVAADKTEEEKAADEDAQSAWNIERPSEGYGNADSHAQKKECKRPAPA